MEAGYNKSMAISGETSTPEIQETITGLRNLEDFKRLPDGVGFFHESGGSTTTYVGEMLSEILLNDPAFRIPTPEGKSYTYLLPQTTMELVHNKRIIGELFHELYWDARVGKVADTFLKRYPNMHWFRGGNMTTDGNGVLILDEASQVAGGADGYLGNPIGALSYGIKDYKSDKRHSPVLYAIPFTKVVEGVRDGFLRLGTPHNYDLTIEWHRDQKKFVDWCEKNLAAFILEGNSYEEAAKIVLPKCIQQ